MNNLDFYKSRKKELKLTNQAISNLSKLPLRTVEDFFRGAYENPRIDTVQAIEKALDLKPTAEWTDEEKALGVGRHPTYLSEDEWNWLELRSELIRVKGEAYYNMVVTMLEAVNKT